MVFFKGKELKMLKAAIVCCANPSYIITKYEPAIAGILISNGKAISNDGFRMCEFRVDTELETLLIPKFKIPEKATSLNIQKENDTIQFTYTMRDGKFQEDTLKIMMFKYPSLRLGEAITNTNLPVPRWNQNYLRDVSGKLNPKWVEIYSGGWEGVCKEAIRINFGGYPDFKYCVLPFRS